MLSFKWPEWRRKRIALLVSVVICLNLYYLYSYVDLNQKISALKNTRSNEQVVMSLDHKLGGYYIVNADKINQYQFDSEGYPVYFVNGKNNRHPTHLVQIALQQISLYTMNGKQSDLDIAKKYADYVVSIVKVREFQNIKYGLVSIDFFNSHYPFLGNTWISGLLQGQTLSLMLRMYQVTGDEQYRNTAELMYESYKLPHEQGGFVSKNGKDLYFDECVSEPATHIVNGHIYAVMGLLDYWRVYRKPETENMLKESIETVERNLARYTVPGTAWTYYDDPGSAWAGAAYVGYQSLHPRLMRVLSQVSENPKPFLQYADFWETAFDSPKDKILYLITRDYFRVFRLVNRNKFQGIPYP